jgi:hypothetical protein
MITESWLTEVIPDGLLDPNNLFNIFDVIAIPEGVESVFLFVEQF